MCVLNSHVMFITSKRASNGSDALQVTKDSLLVILPNGPKELMEIIVIPGEKRIGCLKGVEMTGSTN